MTDLIQQLEAWADAQAIKSPYKQTYDRCRLREGAQGVLDLLAPVIAAADELIGQDEVNAPRGQWERVIADLRAKLGEK